MGKKDFIQKLKTGIIGLSLISSSYFNSFNTNAQNESYHPEYNTTTHYIMKEIQKEGPSINLKNLDNIISQTKIIIKENYKGDPYNTKEAKQLMEKIEDLIEKKYESVENHPCYEKTLIYLAIAEVNKLPLYPVMIPSHIFLRWDPDGIHKQRYYSNKITDESIPEEKKDYLTNEENPISNKGDFNWDPNFLKSFEDFWYRYFFDCHIAFGYDEIKEGIYLKNLNKKELLSYVYTEESIHSLVKEFYGKALNSVNKALELNSKNITAYHNKGKILYAMGKDNCKNNCEKYFEESIENYKKAKELTDDWSSFYPKYFFGIAWALKSLGKYEEAEKTFNELFSRYREPEKEKELMTERFNFYAATNQNEKAKKDLIKLLNLDEFKITEHNKKTIYIIPNKLRGQNNDWNYAEENCKKIDTLGGGFRLPSIEELESIHKTDASNFWFGEMLWSSTKDSLSEKKMLVKNMETGEVYKISKGLDYYIFKLEKIPINSVCVQTIEGLNLDDELISKQRKNLLKDY